MSIKGITFIYYSFDILSLWDLVMVSSLLLEVLL